MPAHNLVSLPMYDLPELRSATDGFWQHIAKRLKSSALLSRSDDWSAPWHNPNLLFSQTCGYPFTHAFAGHLTYVATPHYNADGCDGPNYRSIIFARELRSVESLRGHTAAINSSDSMSGMLALKLVFKEFGIDYFTQTIETGSHVKSLRAVQDHQADVCAIDCVTVAILKKYRPLALQGLVEIARSPAVPGLPYVTRAGNVTELRTALSSAATTLHAKSLLISGLTIMPANAYAKILELEDSLKVEGRS
jgi:ABC-type phosphate/phosphonate transport system substrate-binding protein